LDNGVNFDDILIALKFTSNRADFNINFEDEEQVESLKKLILMSAKFLRDTFP